MTDLNPLTAGLLEASAGAYASAASRELQLRSSQAGAGAFADSQRAWFVQRILELAAAVRLQAPELFVRRASWLRRALLARGADDADLRHALSSLRDALRRELPEHVADTATRPIDRAIDNMNRELESETSELDSDDPLGRLTLRYLEECLAAEPERAIEVVMRGLDTFSPQQLMISVLAAAEREIGRLWHAGDVTVAEERLVSETTRRLLAIISYRSSPPQAVGRTVLAASVAGNIHDLGIRLVSDLFRLAGWRCIFLGATMPSDQLAHAAAMFEADLVILSATLATQLSETGSAIAAIRASSPHAKILVGGAAFEDAPLSWRQVGADAYAARIDDAVATAAALFD